MPLPRRVKSVHLLNHFVTSWLCTEQRWAESSYIVAHTVKSHQFITSLSEGLVEISLNHLMHPIWSDIEWLACLPTVHPSVKASVMERFTKPSSLHVVIATVAFGMGINCCDVRLAFHWGVPEDIEMYIQESGRIGRDGLLSYALIVYGSGDLNKKYTSEQMIKYCVNDESVCRRKLLFEDFAEYTSVGSNVCVGCKC